MIKTIKTINFKYFSDTDYYIMVGIICPACGRHTRFEADSGQTKLSFDFGIRCEFCGNHFITDYRKIKNEVNKQIKKEKMVNTKMTKSLDIPNGVHEFEIKNSEEKITEYKGKEVSYINFNLYVLDVSDNDGKPVNMRVGFPNNLSTKSQYGRFIAEMGIVMKIGDTFDSDVLDGKCFSAHVKNVSKGDNEYAEIGKSTITLL